MATITLSVPDKLKVKMDKSDWINWSSVARHAFAETLEDVNSLKIMKRVREISEISETDMREVKESIIKELKCKTRASSGKSMSSAEFSRWCDSL